MNNIYKNERWKQIEFDDIPVSTKYEISNMGRVKSYALDKVNGRIINGSDVNGYKSIMVRTDDGNTQSQYVHRLVAQYFLDKPMKGSEFVIHLDYDKKNNSMYNLKWVSKEELVQHNNQNPAVIKKRTTGYKLTEPDVIIIKKLLKSNKTRLSMIAKRFKITHTQLNRIRSGENWGHVKV